MSYLVCLYRSYTIKCLLLPQEQQKTTKTKKENGPDQNAG